MKERDALMRMENNKTAGNTGHKYCFLLMLKVVFATVFASLFCICKREHFRNKKKCFYFTSKALFIL